MNPRPSVIVDGVTAHTVADCPHPIGSPAGIAWCRKFTWLQSSDRDFLRAARAAADDRIEAVTGHRMPRNYTGWPPFITINGIDMNQHMISLPLPEQHPFIVDWGSGDIIVQTLTVDD